MKSPFKFLDSYELADKDTYFGRETEYKTLFKYIRATQLALVYGLSGTGKTSLVQCGLAQCFEGPDWHPFYIKRGDKEINLVLIESLRSVLKEYKADASVNELINEVFFTYSRPVYLIFDQFEEIFTTSISEEEKKEELKKNRKQEREEFFQTVRTIIQSPIPCKIILLMREEFIGQLYEYERIIPTLFDFRLRIEPMNEKKIDEVVTKTFSKFNITTEFEDGIVTNLVQGQATSQLAYLQVYLDRLWKTAYQIKYAEKEWSDTPPPVQITKNNLEKVGNVNEVLELYLEDQIQEISKQLNKAPEIIRALLDKFVTEDGTKRPIDKSSQLLNLGNKLTENDLKLCLQLLQEARLLRDDNQYYELAHDALAGIVDGKRTAQQRFIKNLAYSLRTNFELYKKAKGGFLPEENVVLYDNYKVSVDAELEQVQNKDQSGVQLKQEINDYITASRNENEKERKELEIKNQRLRWLNRFITILILLSFVFAFLIWDSYKDSQTNLKTANDNLNKYNREKANQLILEAKTYEQSGDTADALENILRADSLLPNDSELDSLILKYTPKIKL